MTPPTKKYIKFEGKFKELIPKHKMEFNKYFAKKYKAYSIGNNTENNEIMIWQHKGGYVELFNQFHNSYLLLELCIAWRDNKLKDNNLIRKASSFLCGDRTINYGETLNIRFHINAHKYISEKTHRDKLRKLTEKQEDSYLDLIAKTYATLTVLHIEDRDLILDLYDKKLFSIQVDNRK